ncbi:alpha/beta hydrolase-fold protein [Myxococcota bacterium]|nr:alpha/beta hydrolase-fold protein [Myxococcota bacterium]
MDLLYTAHVPAGPGPFPTVVALHGWGASAHDLLGLAPLIHRGEAVMLCPQGPVSVPIQPGMSGYGWFPLGQGREPDATEVDAAAQALLEFIERAKRSFPVDPHKLVILGFSQGGVMAYRLALDDPSRFSGLVALSSWLPDALAAQQGPGPAFEDLPSLVMHGTEDPMIPVARGQDSRDSLLRLGVPTVYREYEMGHEINPEALRSLVGWLDEKIFAPLG